MTSRVQEADTAIACLLWHNPELTRHIRSRLRGRLLPLAAFTWLACLAAAAYAWMAVSEHTASFSNLFFAGLFGAQYLALLIGCAYYCGRAIPTERESQTFDLLCMSRLTPAQITIGKVLGEPIAVYYAVAVSLPVSLGAASWAGVPFHQALLVYLILVVHALVVSLFALWLSILSGESKLPVAAVVTMFTFSIPWASVFTAQGRFPGLAAMSVLPALQSHLGGHALPRQAPLFGVPVDFAVLTLLLYAALGCWLAAMVVPNVKRERDQIRRFTPGQAPYFALTVNVVFYAFLAPPGAGAGAQAGDLIRLAVLVSGAAVTVAGIASTDSLEGIRIATRSSGARSSVRWVAAEIAAPILLMVIIAYAMLAAAVLARRDVPHDWALLSAAAQFVPVAVFAVRDVLFVQYWRTVTQKNQVMQAALAVCAYHAGAIALPWMLGQSHPQAAVWLSGLTPYRIGTSVFPAARYHAVVSLAAQFVLIGVILRLLASRVSGSFAPVAHAQRVGS